MRTAAEQVQTEPLVLRSEAGTTGTLTLNRPQQYNALTVELLSELEASLAAIAQDPSIRVVVLTGSGRAFCPGCDLKQMRANPEKDFQQALFAQCNRITAALMQLPQPVIARVNGTAVAMGCQLVAACDLAVASREARFGVCGINQGLFCAAPGVALSRNVPRKRAFEMLFAGTLIDAATAEHWGLINKAVAPDELDDAVDQYAGTLAVKLPKAVRSGKAMFYRQFDMDLPAAFGYAADIMARDMMDDDVREGIDAFIEKRKPAWLSET